MVAAGTVGITASPPSSAGVLPLLPMDDDLPLSCVSVDGVGREWGRREGEEKMSTG
jgi:hypothetical protein